MQADPITESVALPASHGKYISDAEWGMSDRKRVSPRGLHTHMTGTVGLNMLTISDYGVRQVR